MILNYPGLRTKKLLSALPEPQVKDKKGKDNELVTQVRWFENDKQLYGITIRYRSGESYMTPLSVSMHKTGGYEIDITECIDGCLNGQDAFSERIADIEI